MKTEDVARLYRAACDEYARRHPAPYAPFMDWDEMPEKVRELNVILNALICAEVAAKAKALVCPPYDPMDWTAFDRAILEVEAKDG